MTGPARAPLLYVLALVAIFVIAFGVGRAWGPESDPVTHDAPSHGVIDTSAPEVSTPETSTPETSTEATSVPHDQHGGEH
ncbi:hypothetical protein [Gordonia aurantiaca]|uniref:hypothetical protein n=1 Tax=Gordonia sp. B21 TaxID=3151852 RepID=UPI0032643130